jgi:hydrophobic/amphiphilic exporter-1 (mainly G- bacteria), HAE1 family
MSRFFINRPVTAIVISILIVIGGIIMAQRLPIAQFPSIAPPEIVVTTNYVGADALTIESAVATPIEEAMAGVEGMLYMRSFNANDGTMKLRIDFDLDLDPNIAEVFSEIRVNRALPQLPPSVRNQGVTIAKSHVSPLMIIALSSPRGTRDAKFLANYAYINIIDPLTRVRGIGSVMVQGAGAYAMRQWVKPDQLASLGVTVPDLVKAIEQQNTVNPSGQVGAEPSPPGQEFTYTMRAQGRLVTDQDFGDVVVRENKDGSVVRMRDVARIELGAQTYNVIGRLNDAPAAVINVFQLPGYNAVEAVNGVRKMLVQLKEQFPDDVDYVVSLDTTLSVREGIKEIVTTLWEALLLVIFVVFVFLQSFRTTLIPALTVPVSLLGTFIFFPMLGFSINSLSLFGLVLAIGLVVDDAIVVVEAVELNMAAGLSPKDASLKAMEQVGGPVVAIALILAAVFVPTAFIPGITGRLYQQFAVTIAISVLISAFNALSLSPALCSLLLKPAHESKGLLKRAFAGFNNIFDKATKRYVGISGALIRKMYVSLTLLAVIAAAALVVGDRLPSGFLPDEDQGYFYLNIQLPDAASLQRTDAFTREVESVLKQTKGVQYYSTIVGSSLLTQTNATYSAFVFVALKPWDQRKTKETSIKAIMESVNDKLDGMPAGHAFAFLPPAISGVGTSGGFSFMLEDRVGKDVAYLAENTGRFLEAARKRPELTRLNSSLNAKVPQVLVQVDRDKVLKQGVEIGDVYTTLRAFMGSLFVNYFNRFGRAWQVYIAAEDGYRSQATDVMNFFVRNKDGEMLPLSSVISLQTKAGPEFTSRFNEYRAVEITGSPASGFSTVQAMNALEQTANQVLPKGMGYDWNALSYQQKKASTQVSPAAVFGFSLLVVFLILAAQYESWALPFSVLLATPIAVLGAFLALWIRGFENNVYAQIGLVMLIGLSAKNAILIVEFARAQRLEGKSALDAALEGARIRLRPILMTAFAFIFGTVPLAVASGAGAAARRILGTAVIGGMLAATLFAIFIIPVSYYAVEHMKDRLAGRKVEL